MRDKTKKHVNNLKGYKMKSLKPILYKTIFSLSIILFVLLLQTLNFKSTKWVISKVKYGTEYELDIKTSSLKFYNRVKHVSKDVIKESKEKISVFNMGFKEKYPWPIEGEIYKFYEAGRNEGLDIRSTGGNDPKAIIHGKVIDVYLQENQGYFVTIGHDDVEITYGYLSKSYLAKDETVDLETPIGVLGTNKDGKKYLRIELKVNGQYKDPLDYIDLK